MIAVDLLRIEATPPPERVEAPDLDAHLGRWRGVYRYYDVGGALRDEHLSELELKRTGNQWWQRNLYRWPNGIEVEHTFDGWITARGDLAFDTPRLQGVAWGSRGVVLLEWLYKESPESVHHELISLVTPNLRQRSWHLVDGDGVRGFVHIVEARVE